MKKKAIAMTVAGLVVATGAATVLAGSSSTDAERKCIAYVGSASVDEADSFKKAVQLQSERSGYPCIAVNMEEDQVLKTCLNMVNTNVDALIAAPGSEDLAVKIAEIAHANDIPVVIQSLGKTEADYDYIIGQTGNDGGTTAARCAVELLED